MYRLALEIILTLLLAFLAFASHLIDKEWTIKHSWYRPSLLIAIGTIAVISVVLFIFDYHNKKKSENEISTLQLQLNNQTDEIYNLKVIALSTNQKIDDLNKPQEQISGKSTQFEVEGVPPISDYFPLVFKSNFGLITGYVRVKGTKEFHRFSTKGNAKIPVVVKNLWIPEKGQYQSPPILELVIDHQADEKATLSIYTTGFFLPDGM
jgi:hypothetical protein